MKTILVLGVVSVLTSIISGCNNPSIPAGGSGSGGAATLVGTWNCVTKSEGGPAEVSDSKTFSADGSYSSSKYPEGKKYPYQLDGDKLIVSMHGEKWTEKLTTLTANSLEYYNDKSGQPVKVICTKS